MIDVIGVITLAIGASALTYALHSAGQPIEVIVPAAIAYAALGLHTLSVVHGR